VVLATVFHCLGHYKNVYDDDDAPHTSVNQYASRLLQHLLSSLYVMWLKNTAKEEYLRLFVLIGLDFLI